MFTKAGYRFNGWADTSSGRGNHGINATVGVDDGYKAVREYYATWIKEDLIKMTLTIDPNGGYINDTNQVYSGDSIFKMFIQFFP